MKPAPAAAEHFLHRASEVDVDHLEAGLHQRHGPGGELLRLGAHQLPTHRPLFRRVVQKTLRPPSARLDTDEELVEHHLAQRVRRPVSPGDDAHRPVAVTGEGRLDDGKGKLKVADTKHHIALAIGEGRAGLNWARTRQSPLHFPAPPL